MDQQDNQWLAEYRQGRIESLSRLVEKYRKPLFGFIHNMLQHSGDAEEIFQETWFRAIRSLDSYRDKSFLSWLFRISHNLIIDRVRKAKPMVELNAGETEETNPIESRFAATSTGPDSAVAGRELGHRIEAAVVQLPEEQREVFLMRTKADLPFKEIARIQKISINTALARMQYALAKLRAVLKDDYELLGRS